MTSEKEHWIKNPWVVGIGLIFLTLVFTDLYNKTPILTSLKRILNADVKIWMIVLILLLGTGVIKYINFRKNLNAPIAKMLHYTADKFSNNIWKWKWSFNTVLKRYEITDIAMLCNNPDCEHQSLHKVDFHDDYNVWEYQCPKCKWTYSAIEEPNDIEQYLTNRYKDILERDFTP